MNMKEKISTGTLAVFIDDFNEYGHLTVDCRNTEAAVIFIDFHYKK